MRSLLLFCAFVCVALTATSPPWIAPESYCNCDLVDDWFDGWNPAQIWIDIVIIIDTTGSMGNSLESAKAMLTSFISLMSTNTNRQLFSRIGVVAGSDTTEVVYNLNMSYSDNLDSVKPSELDKMNFDIAFQAAVVMLNDGRKLPSYSDNRREIIYILTKAAPPGAFVRGVDSFKTRGGTVIVNDYVTDGDFPVQSLAKIASENYYFSNLTSYVSNLAVLCEANCFCDPTYSLHPFNDDERNPRTQANRGCFHTSSLSAPLSKAREVCQDIRSALVSIHDAEKEFFVNSVVSGLGKNKKYWIALQYNGSEWNWDDQSTDPFNDWDVGQPYTDDGQLECAYATQAMGLNVKWTATNCSLGGYVTVCESAPCSLQTAAVMPVFDDTDPKYIHCCGCHIKRLARILATTEAVIVGILVLILLFDPSAFDPAIVLSLIFTGIIVYSTYYEYRNGVIAYLVSVIIFSVIDIYEIFNHPIVQNSSSNTALTISLVIFLAIEITYFRVFYLFQDYLREKHGECALPMTVQEATNPLVPHTENHTAPPAYEEPSSSKSANHSRNLSVVL